MGGKVWQRPGVAVGAAVSGRTGIRAARPRTGGDGSHDGKQDQAQDDARFHGHSPVEEATVRRTVQSHCRNERGVRLSTDIGFREFGRGLRAGSHPARAAAGMERRVAVRRDLPQPLAGPQRRHAATERIARDALRPTCPENRARASSAWPLPRARPRS